VTLSTSPSEHPAPPLVESLAIPELAPATTLVGGAAPSRQQLTNDLLDALTVWHPTDRLSAFRVWQRRALSLIHLQVITILEVEGPLAMGRLAELTGVSVASATGIVARMEGRHLVERHHDAVDRRIVLVGLTPTGRRVFRVMEQRRRTHLRKVLAQLNEEELASFLVGLRAVKAAGAAFAKDHAAATSPVATHVRAADVAREENA
jgi:DNA-binding MarR family transcriptional regulator